MKKYIKNTTLGLLSIATIATPIVAISCGKDDKKDEHKKPINPKIDDKNNNDNDKHKNDKKGDTTIPWTPLVPAKKIPVNTTEPWKTLTPALKIPQTFDESKANDYLRITW